MLHSFCFVSFSYTVSHECFNEASIQEDVMLSDFLLLQFLYGDIIWHNIFRWTHLWFEFRVWQYLIDPIGSLVFLGCSWVMWRIVETQIMCYSIILMLFLYTPALMSDEINILHIYSLSYYHTPHFLNVLRILICVDLETCIL
jgi:hypothetical protein